MVVTEGMKKISDALTIIRDKYGESVIGDVSRMRSLLADFCPQYKMEAKIFIYFISDEALIKRIISSSDILVEEVIQAIEQRTGLAKEWAFGVTFCFFKYLGRSIDESLSKSDLSGFYQNHVNFDKIQNPTAFFRAITDSSNCVLQQAEAFSTVQGLERICSILGGEKGKTVADLLKRDAPAYVKEGVRTYTEIISVKGMQFNRGFLSPYFSTSDDSSIAILECPLIFLVEGKINLIDEIMPLLEKIVQENYKLLVVAEDFGDEVLKTLIECKQRGFLSAVAVKSPGYGDRRRALLKDLAVLTGGFVFPSNQIQAIDDVSLDMLGKAGEVRVTIENTLISYAEGDESKIKERVEHIIKEYNNSTSDFDKEKLMERYENFNKGIAVLSVGGSSEEEIKKETQEYQKLLSQIQEALNHGLPQDKLFYLDAADKQLENKILSASEDEKMGMQIVQDIVKTMEALA